MKPTVSIPYSRPTLDDEDIAAVVSVLRSDFLTQGTVVPRFEAAMAENSQASHAISTNSATSALHIACLALGLSPGDWLWTSPITYVASANCGRFCGAEVDFVDIEPGTLNMSVTALAAKLADAEKTGCLPRIVVPVHFAGAPCNMPEIHRLSRRYGFRILEDASHALGAAYVDGVDAAPGATAANLIPVGSCRHSDITVFSFHAVKVITTGEGGMALTQDRELAARMLRLRSHGVTRDPELMQRPDTGEWYYEQLELGFNYRMTEFQAALGLRQLQRLDTFRAKRAQAAALYHRLLARLPVIPARQDPSHRSALHLYPIQVPGDRARIFAELRAQGIGVNVHYLPVYRQPYYQSRPRSETSCPNAERYYQNAMSLPLFPGLADDQIEYIVACLSHSLDGVS